MVTWYVYLSGRTHSQHRNQSFEEHDDGCVDEVNDVCVEYSCSKPMGIESDSFFGHGNLPPKRSAYVALFISFLSWNNFRLFKRQKKVFVCVCGREAKEAKRSKRESGVTLALIFCFSEATFTFLLLLKFLFVWILYSEQESRRGVPSQRVCNAAKDYVMQFQIRTVFMIICRSPWLSTRE